MANRKLDMGRAWTQATGLIGANRDLVSALAGLFLFIPLFVCAYALLGSDIDLGAGGGEPDPERMRAQINALLLENWWALLLTALGQLCGSIAILALLGDRSRPTVREVLGLIPRLILPVFAAQLLIGVVTQGLGAIGGAVPGGAGALISLIAFPISIYLTIKFCLVSAVIVIGHRPNPITAMRESWRLTRANSFRLLAFFAVLVALALVIALILILIVGLVLAAAGERVALIGNAAFVAALLAAFYTISYALSAAIFHQLSEPAPELDVDLFD